jgi:hypothetical protein
LTRLGSSTRQRRLDRAPSRETIASMAAASTMNGGASSTWSPFLPSTVPPIG